MTAVVNMSSKNDSKWYLNYQALKAYIFERGHLPDKHVVENRALLSWAKYQRKKIKEGSLEAEKRELFESLLATHRGATHNVCRHRQIFCGYNNWQEYQATKRCLQCTHRI